MMLTRLPVGRLSEPVPTLDEAGWAFPLVGLLTGGAGWVTLTAVVAVGLSPYLAALAALAVIVWLTGALHEDGLADFADGMGGGRDAAHCLDIMRDSRIGSYGVVALIFVTAFKVMALAEMSRSELLAVLLFVGVASRMSMLAVLVWLPSARPDGLGHSATGPHTGALLPGATALLLIAILLGPQALIIILGTALGAAVVAWIAYRRIRGQTGDVLGATQSISEAVGLVTATAVFA
jgi:adenosylcobinamide-GDP ribazoletransferase